MIFCVLNMLLFLSHAIAHGRDRDKYRKKPQRAIATLR